MSSCFSLQTENELFENEVADAGQIRGPCVGSSSISTKCSLPNFLD
jgi:hypothetical protein